MEDNTKVTEETTKAVNTVINNVVKQTEQTASDSIDKTNTKVAGLGKEVLYKSTKPLDSATQRRLLSDPKIIEYIKNNNISSCKQC